MRPLADAGRIRAFLKALSREAEGDARVYLTGGATAALLGWRSATIDVDLKLVPEQEGLLRALAGLKESLNINVELAAPDQFIPAVAGWEERSLFVSQEGRLAVFHYDLYSQALAKLERGHRQDLEDAQAMLQRGLIEPERLLALFKSIEPELYRFPAIDADTFRRSVELVIKP